MNQEFGRQGSSNATVEQLGLLEHWNNPVMLLMKGQNPVIDGYVNIYLTTESINKKLTEITNQDGIAYCQMTCIQAVHIAIKQQCYGLVIGGLTSDELYIPREELGSRKTTVDGIIKMMEIVSEITTKQEAFTELQEREFYLLGELSKEAFLDHTEELDVMRGEGDAYDVVKLYIVKEHASENNARNLPLNSYKFGDIVSFLAGRYAVTVEPDQGYRVTFSKEELVQYR